MGNFEHSIIAFLCLLIILMVVMIILLVLNIITLNKTIKEVKKEEPVNAFTQPFMQPIPYHTPITCSTSRSQLQNHNLHNCTKTYTSHNDGISTPPYHSCCDEFDNINVTSLKGCD